jgi:lon-related putative ATP-dependent protease
MVTGTAVVGLIMAEASSTPPAPLPPDKLCWRCDPRDLDFETTNDLEDVAEVVGQSRAVEAITFAVGMRRSGYNIFALGPEGIGKHTTLRHFFERAAKDDPTPSDWCYVSDFHEPRKPKALRLPAGRGTAFKADMSRFVDDLQINLRSAFESDEYRTRRQVIEEEVKERREKAVAEVEQEANGQGIALLRTPIGFAFGPTRDGRVVSAEEFQRFAKDEQQKLEAAIEGLQEKLKQALQKAPQWIKEAQDQIRELNDETALFAVGHLVEALGDRYTDLPEILSFLEGVREDVIGNVEAIVAAPQRGPEARTGPDYEDGQPLFRRYRVNLIVDHGAEDQAPVVYEDDPTYDRLLGRIEHRAEMGTLLTDFHMIRPGALHRANDGYLVLDARKVLTRPLVWEALKRALLSQEIRTEPIWQALGLISTVTLEPEPIPLAVKVALVGERMIYYLLSQLDPEFDRLFKVAADFDEHFERNAEHSQHYARLIATLARRDKLAPFDREGVARVLRYAARRAGDVDKLSAEIERLGDLLREADYQARQNGSETVGRAEVEKAVDSRESRLSRVRERVQEQIEQGTVAIDTQGAVVGQVNGLSVLQLGGFAFGRPSRITARVRLGRGEVVDIEREVELGGPIHSKGVLILSGYLSSHYGGEQPLSLSASLVFEQSYGEIEGDSASSAELYALLSAIAEVPLKQALAVTGSVNQRGEVQAIGGVNEKIEGYFDLCAARGLTGDQGVLIPASNLRHLMLHERVLEAAEADQFRIYPVATIEQGIALLSGLSAGCRTPEGRFPADSFNRRVEDRLADFAAKRRAFAAAPKTASGEDKGGD